MPLSPARATDTPSVVAETEDGTMETAEPEMIKFPYVKLRMLDKITARTMTFNMRVGSTVKFGDIYVKAQTCQEPPPIEEPESATFLQIWEELPDNTSKWVFSGWMFASSPALSSMDHPIYDVWALDCLTLEEIKAKTDGEDKAEPDFELP